jgi:transposase
MNPTPLYLGIDIAKSHLDLDLPSPNERFPNTVEGVARLLACLPAQTHLVCEATGGYENTLLQAAWTAGRPISLVSPLRVRAYARSCGKLAKTDRLDKGVLSAFGRERQPGASIQPSPTRRHLRALLRAREYLLNLQRQECNHLEHLADYPALLAQTAERSKLFAQQLGDLEVQIRAVVQADANAKTQVTRLQTIKGVGEVTAWTVWADLPELGSLAPGQAAALAGLAPYAHDSGQQNGARHIQSGRATLRRVLYMAAIAASQHNLVLKEVYLRLRQKGKPAKVALIAIARKLIEVMNLLIKNPSFTLAS